MSAALRDRPERPFTGRHMLLAMVAFFGVIIAVNVLMAIAAARTWTGLVVANSYVASQEFQAKEDAAHRQRALGWRPALSLSAGRVSLIVTDGSGAVVELGDVSLQVNRPVGGHDDQLVALVRNLAGGYEAPLALLPGVWDLTIRAPLAPEGPFELHRRITVGSGP